NSWTPRSKCPRASTLGTAFAAGASAAGSAAEASACTQHTGALNKVRVKRAAAGGQPLRSGLGKVRAPAGIGSRSRTVAWVARHQQVWRPGSLRRRRAGEWRRSRARRASFLWETTGVGPDGPPPRAALAQAVVRAGQRRA